PPGQARRPGPHPVEPGADRRGHRAARPRADPPRVRSLPGPGGHRRAARRGARLRAHRLAADPYPVRPAAGADPLAGGAAQPGRGHPLRRRPRSRAGRDHAASRRIGRIPAVPRPAGRPADRSWPRRRGPRGQRASARAGRKPGRARAARPPPVLLTPLSDWLGHISTTGRTSTVIQPLSTPGQVPAISMASSMVSVSRTEYPPSASLVSMNGPSVTPLARTVLAVAGGASWYP